MIDPVLLPRRVLIDSSVLIPALDLKLVEVAAQDCRDFWSAMLSTGKHIVIASPTIAEFVTKRDFGKVPRAKGVTVVGFDLECARFFGEKFSPDVLRKERDNTGVSKQSIKFDAMIIACALRHRVDTFVSLDENQRKLAAKVGLRARQPSDFYPSQRSFSGLDVEVEAEVEPPPLELPPAPAESKK